MVSLQLSLHDDTPPDRVMPGYSRTCASVKDLKMVGVRIVKCDVPQTGRILFISSTEATPVWFYEVEVFGRELTFMSCVNSFLPRVALKAEVYI